MCTQLKCLPFYINGLFQQFLVVALVSFQTSICKNVTTHTLNISNIITFFVQVWKEFLGNNWVSIFYSFFCSFSSWCYNANNFYWPIFDTTELDLKYAFCKMVLVFLMNKSIVKDFLNNKKLPITILQQTVLNLNMIYHVIMQGNVLVVIQIFHAWFIIIKPFSFLRCVVPSHILVITQFALSFRSCAKKGQGIHLCTHSISKIWVVLH